MNPANVKYNNRIIIGLFAAVVVTQGLLYAVNRLVGRDLPMGNLAFGVAVYAILAIYYQRNNLWPRITANPWVVAFCAYIAVSFAYGLWRFRTPTTAVYDLWLFAFIPAVLLIPPFSFSIRVFDRVLAVLVGLYIASALLVVAVFPEILYHRLSFSHYVAIPATFGTGAAYLLLKYPSRISAYTLVGLAGVLTDAVLYGVGGAFRGRLIMALLLLLLFFVILMLSTRVGFGWKFLTTATAAIACAAAIFLVFTRFETQLQHVTDRFTGIEETYFVTGDLGAADARIREYRYFMSLNPNYKLILGHGVGGLWWDFHGMFTVREGVHGRGDDDRRGFAGARTMLHMNWLHVTFKIGFVGFFLLIGMLVAHYRKHRIFLRHNYAWWAFLVFYCAWMTYYGDKNLNARSMIYLMVLVHPWLFRTAPEERRAVRASGAPGYPASQAPAYPRPPRPMPVPALRRAFPPQG